MSLGVYSLLTSGSAGSYMSWLGLEDAQWSDQTERCDLADRVKKSDLYREMVPSK